MSNNDFIKGVREELNQVSSSFCLAKWLQVTIHLQNGQTHSCHHPTTHQIPLEEIKNNPSALHNTNFKKSLRKEMLNSVRPKECHYCWNIEDSNELNISDRTLKSAETWALPALSRIAKMTGDENINPTYLEVSFGNECNLRCAYCAPHISSSIMNEIKEYGAYSVQPEFSLDNLRRAQIFPYARDEFNPYVEAFWKWLPEIYENLEVLRITGGEPLINQNTYKILDHIKNNPNPNLKVAVNSNLNIPNNLFDKFITDVKLILQQGDIKEMEFFTSIDTYGKHAEFVRFGANYELQMANVRKILKEIPQIKLIFMCTFNAFSVLHFQKFLEEITELKKEFMNDWGFSRIILDIPYLKEPPYLSAKILTKDFIPPLINNLDYLKKVKNDEKLGAIYHDFEIIRFERIINWLESLTEDEERVLLRKKFASFINEYEIRKKIKLADYAPEYLDFYEFCKRL